MARKLLLGIGLTIATIVGMGIAGCMTDEVALTDINAATAEPSVSEDASNTGELSSPETASVESTETASTNETAQLTLPAVFEADGVAIRGADPVAYFTQGEYIPGDAAFRYEWSGSIWYFASDEHRALFAANPNAYAPEYGGFCAWAVSQGYTASIDPTAWKIVDGKLYLNYSQGVQTRWSRDIPGNIAKGDANWPGVLSN